MARSFFFPSSGVTFFKEGENKKSKESLNHYRPSMLLFSLEPEQQQREWEKVSARLQSLRALRQTFLADVTAEISTSQANAFDYSMFYGVLFVGALVAACEGFDGITTLLGLFLLPSSLIFSTGILFSALSVAIFYSFHWASISKALGIEWQDQSELLPLYVSQFDEIKGISKLIMQCHWAEQSAEKLAHLLASIALLEESVEALEAFNKQLETILQDARMAVIKNSLIGLAGLLFFANGYFSAQSVALFVCSLFFSASMPAALPVVLFSMAVGCAALAFYWYVEKSALEGLLSSFFGLDEEKMAVISSANLQEEKEKLQHLRVQLDGINQLSCQLNKLQQREKQDLSAIENTTDSHNELTRYAL